MKKKKFQKLIQKKLENSALMILLRCYRMKVLIIENVLGDYTFESYNVKTSPRMIIMAKKIRY